MDEVRISANAVTSVCLRMAKDVFPDARITCSVTSAGDETHVCLTLEGMCEMDKIVALRKAIPHSCTEYTGISIASVMTKRIN